MLKIHINFVHVLILMDNIESNASIHHIAGADLRGGANHSSGSLKQRSQTLGACTAPPPPQEAIGYLFCEVQKCHLM